MPRYQYPWEKLDRIGKRFVVDFPPGATEKAKAQIERRLRAAASFHQTKNPTIRYKVSVEIGDDGEKCGIRVTRVETQSPNNIRVE